MVAGSRAFLSECDAHEERNANYQDHDPNGKYNVCWVHIGSLLPPVRFRRFAFIASA